MRDILYPENPLDPKDAYVSSRKSMAKSLPKRFYKQASVEPAEDGYRIVLDGKKALTPARNELRLPTKEAAEVVAAEWNAAGEVIDPGKMHATRLANVGIDRIPAAFEAVLDDICKYAGSDLVCYRAAGPEGLVERENRFWNPVLAHLRDRYGAKFVLSEGIGHTEQSEEVLSSIRNAVATTNDPIALAAFHTVTTIAGSVLIAIAMRDGVMSPEEAFDAASVEEDWNAHLWGEDAEATERRARRREEFLTAARLFKALA